MVQSKLEEASQLSEPRDHRAFRRFGRDCCLLKLEAERLLKPEERKLWSRFQSEDARFITVHFEYLAVSKRHQGRGVGRILTGQVIRDFATIARLCGIEIMTGSALSEKLLPFYTELGFERYGFASQRPLMYFSAVTALEIIDTLDQSRSLASGALGRNISNTSRVTA